VSQTTPKDVWDFYLTARESLSVHHRQLQSDREAPASEGTARFVGMISSEIDRAFEEMRRELSLQVSMALVAAVEALLMLDFGKRIDDRIDNALYARFLILWKKSTRPKLDDILEAWKEANPGTGDAIGRFKQVVNLRHWMAHGRYWPPQGFNGFDADSVVDRARAMERSLKGAMPALITW
jgi:hypothetical protein